MVGLWLSYNMYFLMIRERKRLRTTAPYGKMLTIIKFNLWNFHCVINWIIRNFSPFDFFPFATKICFQLVQIFFLHIKLFCWIVPNAQVFSGARNRIICTVTGVKKSSRSLLNASNVNDATFLYATKFLFPFKKHKLCFFLHRTCLMIN